MELRGSLVFRSVGGCCQHVPRAEGGFGQDLLLSKLDGARFLRGSPRAYAMNADSGTALGGLHGNRFSPDCGLHPRPTPDRLRILNNRMLQFLSDIRTHITRKRSGGGAS